MLEALTEKVRLAAESPHRRLAPNVARRYYRRNQLFFKKVESRTVRAARYSETLMLVGVMSVLVSNVQ